jgi:hypothetical protein
MKKIIIALLALSFASAANATGHERQSAADTEAKINQINNVNYKLIAETGRGLECHNNGGTPQIAYDKRKIQSEREKKFKKIGGNSTCYAQVLKYGKKAKGYYLVMRNFNCTSLIVGLEKRRNGNYFDPKDGGVRYYKLKRGQVNTIEIPHVVARRTKNGEQDRDSSALLLNRDSTSCEEIKVNFK